MQGREILTMQTDLSRSVQLRHQNRKKLLNQNTNKTKQEYFKLKEKYDEVLHFYPSGNRKGRGLLYWMCYMHFWLTVPESFFRSTQIVYCKKRQWCDV